MSESEWHLVLVDADGIQSYVLAAKELKMIRGASALQRDLNFDHLLKMLMEFGDGNLPKKKGRLRPTNDKLDDHPRQQWEIISAAGGNVMVLFRSGEDARSYVSKAEAAFEEQTGVASATGVAVRWIPGDFKGSKERVYARLHSRKSARATPANLLRCAYGKPCESCGLQLAAGKAGWGDDKFLCIGCQLRRAAAERSPYLNEVEKTWLAQRISMN